MPRKINMEKRNEILKISYNMVCKKEYDEVFVRDIAEEAGISKALFQHYFAKKSDILKIMLNELLEVSFHYVDSIITKEENLYLRLSLYTNIFFNNLIFDKNLYKFIANIISNKDLLKMWIHVICEWLNMMKAKELENISEREVQIALAFSMAGGTELVLLNEKLNIPISFIVKEMVASFMRILNNNEEAINNVTVHTNTELVNIDLCNFNQYCKKNIYWYK